MPVTHLLRRTLHVRRGRSRKLAARWLWIHREVCGVKRGGVGVLLREESCALRSLPSSARYRVLPRMLFLLGGRSGRCLLLAVHVNSSPPAMPYVWCRPAFPSVIHRRQHDVPKLSNAKTGASRANSADLRFQTFLHFPSRASSSFSSEDYSSAQLNSHRVSRSVRTIPTAGPVVLVRYSTRPPAGHLGPRCAGSCSSRAIRSTPPTRRR